MGVPAALFELSAVAPGTFMVVFHLPTLGFRRQHQSEQARAVREPARQTPRGR